MSQTTTLYAPTDLGLLLGVGTLVYLTGRYWNWPGSRHKDMPPGPPPLPIVGNMHQLKPKNIFMQLCDLNKKYGPIASLKIGSSNMIVIAGDGTVIRELFDKRGTIYSNRPLEISSEIAGGGDHALWERDTNKWRVARKQMVQHYPRASKNRYAELQEAESVQLLYDFLHSPERHIHHPMRYATSVVACLNYGVRCTTYDDPVVCEIEDILNRLTMINIPGTKPPVEQFPWMWSVNFLKDSADTHSKLNRYLPGFITGHWKDKVKEIGKLMDKLYCGLADIGWERGVGGLSPDNLAYKLRLNEVTTGITRHRQAHVCGLVLEAGSDIVAAVISTCIMAMVKHEAYQERAQGEIDNLYNEETLPKWEDEHNMPFVRAVVREALRWRTPLPMGVPHMNEQDDYYGGYFIPKGSTIICNAAAIHLNPTRYEDPESFKPERFLNHTLSMAESAVQSDPLQRDHFSFGAGRRSCPGIQVAEQDIFIALARLLWAFKFSAPSGASIVTDQLDGFFGEVIRRPKHFPLSITARSEQRKATIERELISARESVYSLYGSYK
ncbi:cytochrome P450 family protein [Rhizoctonia solani AG-3 Rhs1AP]|uniref:Cytochrome P450 family protein n=1 Tax=Rhizoctonia solani AG-3 Rhs1AP TaxID=1086054 RepID=X8JM21_9AGAM|nr:cytochrome P450 family protein [Rhizoctonia solani AG-3 Rhs1AP]